MPLTVVATLVAREGQEAATLEALSGAVGPTHDEGGNLLYALHRDANDPRVFVIVERWTSQVALESHFQQPHMTRLLARVDELLSEPPKIRTCEAIDAGGDPMKGSL